MAQSYQCKMGFLVLPGAYMYAYVYTRGHAHQCPSCEETSKALKYLTPINKRAIHLAQ